MEKEVLESVNVAIHSCLERADKLETGSEERERELKNAANLMKLTNEDYKFKEEALDRAIRTDNEKKHSMEELEIKKLQAETEAESRSKVSPDTKWSLAAMGALTIGGIAYEKSGNILPRWMQKVYSWIKK